MSWRFITSIVYDKLVGCRGTGKWKMTYASRDPTSSDVLAIRWNQTDHTFEKAARGAVLLR